mmetsp:Transcript_76965/g.215918  ORF Transcript_76965/g.215918 Transcript_76965/m.215918 type:complete len:231 (-) Transcript_76965:118-810(-)
MQHRADTVPPMSGVGRWHADRPALRGPRRGCPFGRRHRRPEPHQVGRRSQHAGCARLDRVALQRRRRPPRRVQNVGRPLLQRQCHLARLLHALDACRRRRALVDRQVSPRQRRAAEVQGRGWLHCARSMRQEHLRRRPEAVLAARQRTLPEIRRPPLLMARDALLEPESMGACTAFRGSPGEPPHLAPRVSMSATLSSVVFAGRLVWCPTLAARARASSFRRPEPSQGPG